MIISTRMALKPYIETLIYSSTEIRNRVILTHHIKVMVGLVENIIPPYHIKPDSLKLHLAPALM